MRLRSGAVVVVLLVSGLAAGVAGAVTPNGEGQPDLSFGTSGTATFNFGSGSTAQTHPTAMVVQPDGDILITGATSPDPDGAEALFVQRLDTDGRPDASFGSGGLVEIDDGEKPTLEVGGQNLMFGDSLALEPNGDVLVGGNEAGGDSIFDGEGTLNRLLPDGQLDTSFGVDGGAYVDDATTVFGEAVAPDGDIVVVGDSTEQSSDPSDPQYVECIAVRELTPDGQPVESFDSAHSCIEPTPSRYSYAEGIDIDPDGNIYVLGTAGGDNTMQAVVMRLLPDGTLDTSYGSGGLEYLSLPGTTRTGAQGLAFSANGGLVVALSGADDSDPADPYSFGVAQLTPDGLLDSHFGEHGITAFSGGRDPDSDVQEDALVVRPDGRLFLTQNEASGGDTQTYLLDSNGELDTGFGENGEETVDDQNFAAATECDNSVLVAGSDEPENDTVAMTVTKLLGPATAPQANSCITPPAAPDSTSSTDTNYSSITDSSSPVAANTSTATPSTVSNQTPSGTRTVGSGVTSQSSAQDERVTRTSVVASDAALRAVSFKVLALWPTTRTVRSVLAAVNSPPRLLTEASKELQRWDRSLGRATQAIKALKLMTPTQHAVSTDALMAANKLRAGLTRLAEAVNAHDRGHTAQARALGKQARQSIANSLKLRLRALQVTAALRTHA